MTTRRDHVFYYRYKTDNARRSLKGIDEQVRKAEAAVASKVPVKWNRFVKIGVASKTVNRELEAKVRGLAGIKGYVTNLVNLPPEEVIGAYHRPYEVEKSFRMSKSDLRARPIFHHTRDSIEAHLTIVFAALAVSRWLENASGWSIRKLVKTLRRYKTIQIRVGNQSITAQDELPADLAELIADIKAGVVQ